MGKKVIVIGATSGIGRGLALHFASMGYKVGIGARRENKLRELASLFPDNMVFRRIDVASKEASGHFTELVDKCGGMDILVFAAGSGMNRILSHDAVFESISANVLGFTEIVVTAYRYFEKCRSLRPQIAAITSVAGTKGMGTWPVYSASKRYQNTFIDAMQQLARHDGVELAWTDIRPGFVRTDLLDNDTRYPLTMNVDYALSRIADAVLKRKRVVYIDWRWGIIAKLWRFMPNWIWRRVWIDFQ